MGVKEVGVSNQNCVVRCNLETMKVKSVRERMQDSREIRS